ncbi:MAG TPA: S8 family serine peptidase [Pyrinomonadaceae bacterium]|nr:S8 family serine peptidase [Pyrinomonadaceae bacterium]
MSSRLIKFAALVALTFAVAASLVLRRDDSRVSASANMVSVIVELKDDPGAVYKAKAQAAGRAVSDEELQSYRGQLTAAQDGFLNALRATGTTFEVESLDVKDFAGQTAATVQYRFTLVYNGVTLKVPRAAVAAIESMPQVKDVHFNGVKRIALDHSVRYVNAPKAYGKIEELTPFDDNREGYEGQGIRIAVLDTGIDWTHPMFGGDPTPPRLGVAPPTAAANNQKVIYYMTTTAGLIDDYGHGSHAAADAAGYLGLAPGPDGLPGTADDVRLHGVAPQARLMAYKVCTGSGDCVDASTILAIEDSVSPFTLTGQPKPTAHVINMSLGGAGGPDDPSATASDNAVLMGTIVVASAGNDGPGEGTVGSPAAGRRVIAVGANTDPGSGVNTADLIGGRSGMKAVALEGSAAIPNDITNNFVYCGLAETADTVPDSVRGRIALISRGSTVNLPELPTVGSLGTGLFATKAANAQAKGATAVIFINNVDGELTAATVYAATVPVLGMSKENGEYLRSLLPPTPGAVSTQQLRINNELIFSADMADFSSRGPVLGFGQIKPDVTAPGVAVLAATSLVGVPANSMQDPSRYIPANGTSFSGPHVAGAAAIVKQAHLDWNADQVRTALINTATNLRDASGTPKTDGAQADSILAQGGGLMDVNHAVNTKALMGVAGDGVSKPTILGSHSYGEVPVVGSRTVHTESVTVTISDVSGQPRIYSLDVAHNRDTLRDGIGVSTDRQSITVPANGSATFNVNATIDGDRIRTLAEPIQMQWYVTARSADGESLRMPFYLKPVPTVPAGAAGEVETLTGTVVAGDGGLQLAPGVTYVDVPVEVSESTFKLEGRLDFPQVVGGLFHDLDFQLLDPAGNVIADSANGGGPEFVSARVEDGGTYVYRVVGFANATTDFTIASTQFTGGSSEPAALNAVAGDFTDSQNRAVDFDGAFTLAWQARGGERGFEVERTADGQAWELVGSTDGATTSAALAAQPNGTLRFRVRSIYPGQIGSYVSDPSNEVSVTVDRRTLTDITSSVRTAIADGSLSFEAGATQMDLTLTNVGTTAYFPVMQLRVVRVSSASGSVSVSNADSGGAGTSEATAAAFDYSRQMGADDTFAAGETTGVRTLRFRNTASEMFTFDARVTAYARAGAGDGTTSIGGDNPPQSGSGGALPSIPGVTSVMRVTVNPLTRKVSVLAVRL